MPTRTVPAFPPLLTGLLVAGLVMAFLSVAKTVVIPLAVAVMLAFVLNPVVVLLERRGLGRLPSVVLTTLFTLTLLAAGGWVVGIQVRGLVKDIDTNKHTIRDKLSAVTGSGAGPFRVFTDLLEPQTTGTVQKGEPAPGDPKPGLNPPTDKSAEDKKPLTVKLDDGSPLERLLPAVEPLTHVALVLVLVVFLLVNREDLRNRLIGLTGHGRMTGTTRILGDAAGRVGKYLLSQLLVNLGFGAILAVGLWLLGVPYAFLWGAMAVGLRFIPYLGTWVAGMFPIAYTFATTPGWGDALKVLAFFAVLDLAVGQVVEPIVFGHSTGVSPVALLVAAAFWAWLWGPLGLLLSTPLTVVLVTLGQHVPQLGFLGLLMGDGPPLAPHLAFYQRLLAKDKGEAEQLATAHAQEKGLADAYDEVMVPALSAAGSDRKRNELPAAAETELLETAEAVRAAVAAPPPLREGEKPPAVPATVATVFGFPARSAADELTLRMLADVLKGDGYPVEVIPTRVMPKAVDARIEAEKPAVAVLSVLPPGGLPQALYQVKRLRTAHPDLPILVAYLGTSRRFDALLVKFRSAGASYVVTTLAQAASQVKALAPAEKSARVEKRQPAGVA